MMKRKENALRLGFTFAGCYLGAGYVSGQELWQFFGCFGWQGIAGLLLAVALSFFLGVLLLRLVQRTGCDQTDALVIRRPIPLLRDAVGLLQLFFLFGILVIMAAGVGALFAQILGASAFWCSAAFCLLVSLLSLTGTSGMVNVFSTVVPLLVICSVLVSALTLRRCGWQLTIAAVPSVSPLLSHWAIAACSFVSYNLFSSIGILAPVGKELRSRRTVWWGVLLGCIILISIALGIFLTMETLPTVVEAPLPMLAGTTSMVCCCSVPCSVPRFPAPLLSAITAWFAFPPWRTAASALSFCWLSPHGCAAFSASGSSSALFTLFAEHWVHWPCWGCCTIASPFARQSSCHRLFLGRIYAIYWIRPQARRRSAPPPQALPVCFAPRGETACGRTFLLCLARLFPAIHP